MKTFEEFMSMVSKADIAPCSAEQGLDLHEVQVGQLHHLRGTEAQRELFALVLSVNKGICRVLPGSLDPHEAGTDDVIVPRSVMGGCISLSPKLVRSVPVSALEKGFARFDQKSFECAEKCVSDPDASPYLTAFPFIGKSDPRVASRRLLVGAIETAVKSAWMDTLARFKSAQSSRPNPFAERWGGAAESATAFAAADVRESVSATRSLDGFDGSLKIRYEPDDLTLTIRVFDADGEKSMALDGWAVLDSNAAVLGYLDGTAFAGKVATDFDGGVRLLAPDGEPHDLI